LFGYGLFRAIPGQAAAVTEQASSKPDAAVTLNHQAGRTMSSAPWAPICFRAIIYGSVYQPVARDLIYVGSHMVYRVISVIDYATTGKTISVLEFCFACLVVCFVPILVRNFRKGYGDYDVASIFIT
jgi:hypothetical protein